MKHFVLLSALIVPSYCARHKTEKAEESVATCPPLRDCTYDLVQGRCFYHCLPTSEQR